MLKIQYRRYVHVKDINKNLATAKSQTDRASAAHTIRRGHHDNPVTLKCRLRVTQAHWKRNRWVDHTRLTISRVT